MTRSEENYLKTIYHLGSNLNKAVSTNAIAQQMETKPSSVTDMVKKLSDKKLVNYRKYQGVTLSDKGKSVALSIIRKHRLWEVFLVDKLHFSWDEVHEMAEQLEHIKSDTLIDRLDEHLGFPKYDPHGDPIPSREGKVNKTDKRLLTEVPLETGGICVGVKDSSVAFLKFLDRNRIALGDMIIVKDKEEFDGSLYIEIDGKEMHISEQIASNLYIQVKDD